ncbi:MAG: DNA starvation/stationary phase protection protein [Myxococcota bacterium]
MTKTNPIRTHLSDVSRDAVAADLQSTAFELIDLALKGKQLHWNVVGPRFHSVHELLDTLIDAQRAWGDMTAERITAIGRAAQGEARDVMGGSPLPELPKGYLADDTAVELQSRNISIVTERLRERVERVSQLDPASEDLLIEVLRGLEKQSWMLQALSSDAADRFNARPTSKGTSARPHQVRASA